MSTRYHCLLLLLFGFRLAQAQIGLGGNPHPSAAVDVPSTTKAAYLPRMSSAQRLAIVNPQPGAIVYDLDKATLYLFDGENWRPVALTTDNALLPISRTAADGKSDDQFGYGIGISGNYAVVGAYSANVNTNINQGAAYVYARLGNTWAFQQKLTAPDGATGDYFGWSAAISGNYLVVGALYDAVGGNTSQGSAYVYVRTGNTWTFQQQLTASDGMASDFFGWSVAIDGDNIVVGAPNDDVGTNTDQGSAYTFVRSGTSWGTQTKITAPSGVSLAAFGQSVSISGDYIVAGAPGTNPNPPASSISLFMRSGNNWVFQQQLPDPYADPSGFFGQSVSVSGDYLVVGAANSSSGNNAAQGRAVIFKRDGLSWFVQQTLLAYDGAYSDNFGSSVAISGDYVIIGATGDDIGGMVNQGSAYIYQRMGTAWPLLRKVEDHAPSGTFNGTGIGISNGSFIIGGSGFENYRGKVSFGTVD